MKLLIFSDVLDPWSWGLEGVLRALTFTYRDLSYEFIMTGLVENYEDFLPKNFSQLNSVELGNKILFDMYRAASTITKFPHFKKIPNLFSEEHKSSYILDKYYNAVRQISYDKSNLYMRRLKEWAILKEENIYDMQVQKEILKELDIDFNDFTSELEFIDEIFLEDRMLAFDYRVKNPPAFLIEDNKRLIKGYKSYEDLCKFFDDEVGIEKREINDSLLVEFISTFSHVLREEINILFSEKILDNLLKQGKILEKTFGNGKIYQLASK